MIRTKKFENLPQITTISPSGKIVITENGVDKVISFEDFSNLPPATEVWNNPSTTFTASEVNVTDIQSAADSKLLDLKINTVSKFVVRKDGNLGIGVANPAARLDISDTLLAGSGSLAGSILNLAQTWNTTGAPTAIKLNVTNTASGAASNLLDLQLGGESKLRVDKTGRIYFPAQWSSSKPYIGPVGSYGLSLFGDDVDIFATYSLRLNGNPQISGYLQFGLNTNSLHPILYKDADSTIGQRNGISPQSFRIYNTYTSSTNFERLNLRWDTNVLKIGTEKGGAGGTARNLGFETDGTTRMTITSTGLVGIGTTNPTASLDIQGASSGIFLGRSDSEKYIYIQTSASTGYTANSFAIWNGITAAWAGLIMQFTENAALIFNRDIQNAYTNIRGANVSEPALNITQTSTGDFLSAGTFRLSKSGNLGIGNTVPAARLDIVDTWNSNISVTGATGTGSVATITFATQSTVIPVGATVVVSSVNPSGYNGTFVVTASTVTSISYTNSTTSTYVSGGLVKQQYDAIRVFVTDTNSDTNSNLLSLNLSTINVVGENWRYKVDKSGNLRSTGTHSIGIGLAGSASLDMGNGWYGFGGGNGIRILNNVTGYIFAHGDTQLWRGRDSVGAGINHILEQRNGTNGQTFNVYNTWSAWNNFERFSISAQNAANVIIGTNKGAAGGLARGLELQTDAVTRMTVTSAGNVGIGTSSPNYLFSVKPNSGQVGQIGFRTLGAFASPALYLEDYSATVIYKLGQDTSGALKILSNTDAICFETAGYYSTIAGNGTFIQAGNSTATIQSNQAKILLDTYTTNAIQFFAGTTTTERMRILGSNGNVGIGTTTPDYKLSVSDTSGGLPFSSFGTFSSRFYHSAYALTYDAGGLDATNNARILLTTTSSNTSPSVDFTNSNSQGRIYLSANALGSGNLNFTVAGYTTLMLRKGDNRQGNAILSSLAGDTTYNNASLLVRNRWDGAPAAVIAKLATSTTADIFQVTNESLSPYFNVSAIGNVGVGTTTPLAKLDIAEIWNSNISVTGASGTGSVATITFAAQAAAIPVGATVVVSNVNPSGYNGNFVVTASSVTSVSYANATSSAYVSGGTVQQLFTALKINITDTASNAGSNLLDLQVGGVSKFRFLKGGVFLSGTVEISGNAIYGAPIGWPGSPSWGGIQQLNMYSGSATTGFIQWNNDLFLYRDAANILAQRNGVNPQESRIYGTYTSSTEFERLNLKYNATNTAFEISTEKGSTSGTNRPLEIAVGGANRWKFGTDNFLVGGYGGGIQLRYGTIGSPYDNLYYQLNLYSLGTEAVVTAGQYIPLSLGGGAQRQWQFTTSGHFLALTDNTYDIGANSATRPRTGYFGTSIVTPTIVMGGGNQTIGLSLYGIDLAGNGLSRANSILLTSSTASATAVNTARIDSPSAGLIEFRSADDSAYAQINASGLGLVSTGASALITTSNGGVADTLLGKIGYMSTSGLLIKSDGVIGFGAGQVNASSIADTAIYRDSSGILAQRNGVNPQAFRLYGTYTDASNYARLAISCDSSGNAILATEGLGTGAAGTITINGLPLGLGKGNVSTNVAIGSTALNSITTAGNNVAIGINALPLVTDSFNTAIGSNALANVTSGDSNTAVGYQAFFNGNGVGNVIIGKSAVSNLSLANNSVFIGSACTGANSASNQIVIGSSAAGIGSNSVVLGNDSILTTVLKGKVGIGTITPSSKLEVVGSIGKFDVSSEGYVTSMTRSNSNLRFAGFNIGIINFSGTADGYTTQQIGAQINSLTEGSGGDTWQLRPSANLLFHTTPNSSGAVLTERMRITGAGDIGIGTSTPAARLDIVDTSLAGSGSLAGSILNLAQTWNTTGAPTAIKLNVTNTTSGAASNLLDLQVGGSSKFRVAKDGQTFGGISSDSDSGYYRTVKAIKHFQGYFAGVTNGALGGCGAAWVISGTGDLAWSDSSQATTCVDLRLSRDGASILAQRNGVNPQTSRIYGTYTDASNYARLAISCDTSGNAILATEGLGTGAAGTITINGVSLGLGKSSVSTNLAIGASSLISNTSGSRNISIGQSALNINTTGRDNTAIGYFGMTLNGAGNENTSIGSQSLFYSNGNNNVALGYLAGTFISGGGNNFPSNGNIYIGSDSRPLASAQTNQVVIGTSAIGIGSNSVVLGNDSILTTVLKGNVGLGTTNPQSKLEVYGATSTLTINTGDGSTTAGLRFAHRDSVYADSQIKVGIFAPAAGSYGLSTGLFFALNNATDNTNVSVSDSKLAILSNGNLGIGTSTPSTKLEIVTTGASIDGLKLNRAADDRTAWLVDEGTGAGALYLFNGSNSNSVFITGNGNSYINSGNLGLGMSGGATAKLDIADTTLAGSGSLAGSILNLAQTWNTTGAPTAIKLNVTNTASGAASNLLDLQVDTVSRFKVNKLGDLTLAGSTGVTLTGGGGFRSISYIDVNVIGLVTSSSGALGFSNGSTGSNYDTALFRDAAGTLAQRNGVNPQAFRLYNTYTDATTFERLNIKWDTNVLKIGTEKGSVGGTARNLAFETDGTTRMTITSAGNVGIGTTSPTNPLHVYGTTADQGIILDNISNPRFSILRAGTERLRFNAVGNIGTISAPSGNGLALGGVADASHLVINSSGNIGIGTIAPTEKLDVVGNLKVSGHFSAATKSFLIDHPTKEGKKLQYGVVESNQHSVLVRGKTAENIIELPEEWAGLVHEDSVTVQLTPIGSYQQLFVISQDNQRVVVGGSTGQYNYTIYGERKDVDKLITEI